MADETTDKTAEDTTPEVNTDYYDKVDYSAYEQSALNRSVPDRAERDLWQSTTISTDDTGPTVDEVAPVFPQARADALANPASDDGGLDEDAKALAADSAKAAQEQADAIRESAGFVAPTGADAGKYDDPKLEGQIPSENFEAAPEGEEPPNTPSAVAPGANTVTDDDTQFQSQGTGSTGESYTSEPIVAPEEDGTSNGDVDAPVDDAPSASTTSPETTTGVDPDADTTHDDLVSDTASEQGGLDASSADGATPKVK